MTKDNISIKSKDGKVERTYAGGQLAYDLWAKSITDDKEFGENTIIPILIERLMCQGDAQTMIGEGRSYAAYFIEGIGRSNSHINQECLEIANQFRAIAQYSFDMNKLRGGFEQTEKILIKFLESEVREKTATLVLKAKQYEYQVCKQLKRIYNDL